MKLAITGKGGTGKTTAAGILAHCFKDSGYDVVDMEAGIEHLGRATAQSIDRMLIVVEPGLRSIQTAHIILKMGKDIGVPSFGILGNKVRSDQQREWITHQFPGNMILGTIPYDESIQNADLLGKPLVETINPTVKAEFQKIYLKLLPME